MDLLWLNLLLGLCPSYITVIQNSCHSFLLMGLRAEVILFRVFPWMFMIKFLQQPCDVAFDSSPFPMLASVHSFHSWGPCCLWNHRYWILSWQFLCRAPPSAALCFPRSVTVEGWLLPLCYFAGCIVPKLCCPLYGKKKDAFSLKQTYIVVCELSYFSKS